MTTTQAANPPTLPYDQLPIPERKRIPDHSAPIKHDRHPLYRRNLLRGPNPTTTDPQDPRLTEFFNCQCGANPLNAPHNLAILAGAYTPITARGVYPEPTPNVPFPAPEPPSYPIFRADLDRYAPSRQSITPLYLTLPDPIQDRLEDPSLSDNLRNVKITDPDSPMLALMRLPGTPTAFLKHNFSDRPPSHIARGDGNFQNDLYEAEEWEDWFRIHQQDQILFDPYPYFMARADDRHNHVGHEHFRRPPLSYSSVSYSPLLPVSHSIRPRPPRPGNTPLDPSTDTDYCWCGASIPNEDGYLKHLYVSFVGRTVMRAMEIPPTPWQEYSLGQYYLREMSLGRLRARVDSFGTIMFEDTPLTLTPHHSADTMPR